MYNLLYMRQDHKSTPNHTNTAIRIYPSVALFLILFILSLTYGPWNGSDYSAYINATICENPLPNLCEFNTSQDAMSYLGVTPDDSVFTQQGHSLPSIQPVFKKMPSTYYTRFLSTFSQPSILLSLLIYNIISASIATFLLVTTFLFTPTKRRSWLICTFALIFMFPAYSQLTATPYPLTLSALAFFLHLTLSRYLISGRPWKPADAFLIPIHLISILLILTTRFETTALLIFDLAILAIRLSSNRGIGRLLRGYFVVLLLTTLAAIMVIPANQGLIKDVIRGDFRMIPNGLVSANPNYVLGSSRPNEQETIEIDDSFTLSYGRLSQVISAPAVYLSELVAVPWLKNDQLFANLCRFLAISGLLFVVWWSRFQYKTFGNRRTILLLSLLLILLPAVSAHGTLRMRYTLPFVLMILWEFRTRRDNWVLPARFCLVLSFLINSILLYKFSAAFGLVNLYFFDLPSNHLTLVYLTSFVSLIYSLRIYLRSIPEII